MNSMPISKGAKLGEVGFTLIELMITVAIIGILAAITYPSYTAFVIRSDRAEALIELSKLANLQEQYFIDHRAYTDSINLLGVGTTKKYTTQTGDYEIASEVGESLITFTLTATAKKNQINDTGCTEITITDTGLKQPIICWDK